MGQAGIHGTRFRSLGNVSEHFLKFFPKIFSDLVDENETMESSFCESQKREQPEHTVDEQKIVVVNIQYRLGKYQ